MKGSWFLFFNLLPFLLFAELRIIDESEKSVTIELNIKNLVEQKMIRDGSEFTQLTFDNALITQDQGKPAVPFLTTRLAVPIKSTIDYELTIIEKITREAADLVPQNVLFIRGDYQQVPVDPDVYHSFIPYPEHMIEIGEMYNFHGVNVVSIRFNPVQYIPQEHRIEIYKKVLIKFVFKTNTSQNFSNSSAISELNLLKYKILNYQQASLYAYPNNLALKKKSVSYDFSRGRWFRIPVHSEGVYQITGAFLNSKNIDISSILLANVQLFGHGSYRLPTDVRKYRPADLNEIAIKVIDENNNGTMDENDRILFYGKGMGNWIFNTATASWQFEAFPYDNTNYYLLSLDNMAGKRIPDLPSLQLPNPEIPVTFTDYFHFEEDRYNILSSGLDWYWLKMSGRQDTKTTQFNLPQNMANGPTNLIFRFKGGSGSFYGDNESYRYDLKVMINNEEIIDKYTLTRNSVGQESISNETLFAIKSGENSLEIRHIGNSTGCEVYLDYFEVNVERSFVAEGEKLRFRKIISNNLPVEFRITGMPAGQNQVWDISDFANIKNMGLLTNGQSITFQDVQEEFKAGEYFTFSPNIIQDISDLESIENHPNLRDPARRAEFLIITPDEFYDAAAFLEDWRETQFPNPLETERVQIKQIYQEFSSSVKDVVAIRDFIRYVYENWADTLKYVLLLGDGHYDYRQIQLKDQPNYIPPFEISHNSEIDSRETDNFYVSLGMQGNLNNIDPWISIGRLPFNNLEQIDIYKEKASSYVNSFTLDSAKNGWQTWITLVADDQFGGIGQGGEYYHLQPTEEVNQKYIPAKFNRSKIYLVDYDQIPGGLGRWKPKATEDLLNQINRGTILINYFGHGDPDTWAHESVLNRSRDLPKFQNEQRLPLWVAATCTWGKYDDPFHTSMSEELIWLPQEGGIGVISASRPVFVFSNVQFAKDLYRFLFMNASETQPSSLLGDAFYLAMEGEGLPNYQKYHLYGDPTLRLADPRYLVKIKSVQPDTMKALSKVTIDAQVKTASGELITDFDGQAVLHCFDAVDSNSVTIGGVNIPYNYHGGTIFKGVVTVSGGELTGSFIVPKSIKYKKNATGRCSIYAWNEKYDAIGFLDTLLFYGSEKQVPDNEGPEIEVAFKDAPNFFDGDFVSNQPTLIVALSDESGLNLSGEVGHRIELIIDSNVKKDVTEFFVYNTDSYQSGKLEYTMPVLSTGNHELKIVSWDNLNNFSERTISFRTRTVTELTLVEVVNFPNPFLNDTYFTFQLVSPVGEANITISVYTVTGRKIQELHEIARQGFNKIYWDGKDWDGDMIANGIYLYKIEADDGEQKVEKIEKLAVVR